MDQLTDLNYCSLSLDSATVVTCTTMHTSSTKVPDETHRHKNPQCPRAHGPSPIRAVSPPSIFSLVDCGSLSWTIIYCEDYFVSV